jgi:tetratricopeptide (TPR) repeat protein
MQKKIDHHRVACALWPRVVATVAIVALVAGCSRKSVESYLQAGDQARQASRLADAETAYQQAIKLAPQDPRPHVALGDLYLFEQKAAPAEAEFMKVLDVDTKNAPAHFALGQLYASQSQAGAAEGQYRAAVVLDPTRIDYRLGLGGILQKEEATDEANEEFRTATGLEPKNAHAHLALANLLNTMRGRQADAQAEYALVRQLDPTLMPAPAMAEHEIPGTTPSTGGAASPPPAGGPKVKATNKKFKLTHDSPLYAAADGSSGVLGQVHRGKFVHVTGIAGDWLQVQLRNGTVGFIPLTAAE